MTSYTDQLKDAFLKNLLKCNISFCLSLATQIQRNTKIDLNSLVIKGHAIPEWLLKINAHAFTVRQFLDHGLNPHVTVNDSWAGPVPWIEAAARLNQAGVVFELLRSGVDPDLITLPVLDPEISIYLAMYTPFDLMPMCVLAGLPSLGISLAEDLLLERIRLKPSHFSQGHINFLVTSFLVHADLQRTLAAANSFSFKHADLFVPERAKECKQLALVMYRRGVPHDIFLHTLCFVSR